MKIEYSDLYKFIVSTGIALLALAFAIPWLFLRESFDLLLTEESLSQLAPVSRAIIEQRQEYLAVVFKLIPWISPTLAVLGLALLAVGIFMWWSRSQRLVDMRQQLELRNIERALTPAQQKDVEVKMLAEASDELEGVPEVAMHTYTLDSSRIEKRIAHILEECYGEDHKLLSNQQIGHALFDFLLLSRKSPLSVYRNYTIEVKYVRRGFKFGWLRDNLLKALYLSDIFEKETELPSFPVLMVVDGGDVLSRTAIRTYTDRLKAEMKSLGASASMVFISEAELDRMPCDRLMTLIEGGTL